MDQQNDSPTNQHPLLLDGDKLLTGEQSARLLQVSYSTFRKYVLSGMITAYRFGEKCTRYKQSDIEAFLSPVDLDSPGIIIHNEHEGVVPVSRDH